MDTLQEICKWHLNNGGHNGRIAGHALRVLNEVVELCVACGANYKEILERVEQEIKKAHERNELNVVKDSSVIRMEATDVSFCLDIVALHTGSASLEVERQNKLQILNERLWEVDPDGVLWRPGTSPVWNRSTT